MFLFIGLPQNISQTLFPLCPSFLRGSFFRDSCVSPRLNDRGFWELHPFVEGDEVVLTSVDFRFPLSLVYEDVVLIGEDEITNNQDR